MTGFLEARRPPQHGAEVPASKPRAGTIWNPPSAAPGPPPQEGALGFNWGASRSPRVLDRKEVPLRSVPVPTAQGPVPARGPDCPRSFPNDPRAGAAHGARTLCRRLGTGREVGGSLSQGWPCFWAELNRPRDVQGGSPTSSSRPLCAGGALISPHHPGEPLGAQPGSHGAAVRYGGRLCSEKTLVVPFAVSHRVWLLEATLSTRSFPCARPLGSEGLVLCPYGRHLPAFL